MSTIYEDAISSNSRLLILSYSQKKRSNPGSIPAFGFCNRATHNLWTLLEENRMIQEHLKAGTYAEWYKEHLHNSTYRPLIDQLVEKHLKQNDK